MRLSKIAAVASILLLVHCVVPAMAAPRRVVSTFLCTDEYVFRLVPRANIAALSFEAGDDHPIVSTIAGKVAGIAQIRPSTEIVLDLHPDLVVMYQGTMPRLHANLLAIGVPVLDVPWANSIDDVRKTTTMLGERLGARRAAADLLAKMENDLAATRARAPHPPVRTLLYEPNGYATAGGVTEELMGIAGLVNVSPDLAPTRAGTIAVESVIANVPELLIFSGRHVADSRAALVLQHPALVSLEGRTYSAWAPLTAMLCPGPWSISAAETLAELGRRARALAKRRAQN